MENLPFVLWMLLFPVVIAISDYIHSKTDKNPKEYSDNVEFATSLTILFIWFFIGYHLFKG